jgi:NADH-quinone oxidoreductase subunit L
MSTRAATPLPLPRALRQGFVVGVSNPKAFMIFAAVLPQFVDRSAGHVQVQMLVLGTLAFVIGIGTAGVYYFRREGRSLGIADRGLAHAGYTFLVNKYYLDDLYTDGVVGSLKGPIAQAAYWFNQNVLDGIVNGAAAIAVATGRFTYNVIDQKVVDGAVNGLGVSAEAGGGALRTVQTGKVQQYAAILFGALVVFGAALWKFAK